MQLADIAEEADIDQRRPTCEGRNTGLLDHRHPGEAASNLEPPAHAIERRDRGNLGFLIEADEVGALPRGIQVACDHIGGTLHHGIDAFLRALLNGAGYRLALTAAGNVVPGRGDLDARAASRGVSAQRSLGDDRPGDVMHIRDRSQRAGFAGDRLLGGNRRHVREVAQRNYQWDQAGGRGTARPRTAPRVGLVPDYGIRTAAEDRQQKLRRALGNGKAHAGIAQMLPDRRPMKAERKLGNVAHARRLLLAHLEVPNVLLQESLLWRRHERLLASRDQLFDEGPEGLAMRLGHGLLAGRGRSIRGLVHLDPVDGIDFGVGLRNHRDRRAEADDRNYEKRGEEAADKQHCKAFPIDYCPAGKAAEPDGAKAVPVRPLRSRQSVISQELFYSKSGEETITSRSYKSAGVDIDAGNDLVEAIKPLAKSTARKGAAAALGGFGALFDLKEAGFEDPVLVAATDGVGTKLRVAITAGNHETVGIDLVAMCVNDLVVQGAEPLFFLDYFATGRLEVDAATSIVGGIAEGCRQAGCALVGGETAEMPGMYAAGDYDLAGFAVGAAERGTLLTGENVKDGDVVLGLESSGLHSNGFSLVRKVVADLGLDYGADCPFEPSRSLASVLLTPTRVYVKACLAAIATGHVNALAHVTGGGLPENLPRVLPDGLGAVIDTRAWELPAVFRWLAESGDIAPAELARTFNCGIGMCVVVSSDHADEVAETLRGAGETVYRIGAICPDDQKGPRVRLDGAEETWRG